MYASGDETALQRLGTLIAQRGEGSPASLVLLGGYGALLSAAARTEEAARADAIELWELYLRADPDSDRALNELTWLYADAGRMEDARRVAAQATEIAQPKFVRATNLMSRGNLAMRDMNYGEALQSLQESVALFSEIANPASTDARVVLHRDDGTARERAELEYTLWIHPPLASALRSLSLVEQRLGRRDEALTHARDSVMHGEIVVQTTEEAGRTDNAFANYLASYLANLGTIELENGRAENALASYKRAAEVASEDGHAPVSYQVQIASAAVAAGQLDEAERQLTEARTNLSEMQPSAYALGTEGLYWEQLAALRGAQGRPDETATAMQRAKVAFSQAIDMSPADLGEWREALARVQ